MAQRVLQDFIGFTFDGVSSEELGITRVSDGDRFNEELHPEIKDITAEVPGKDGEYYFGSTYENKEIEIRIAYDSLTESQFRRLRHLFGGKEIHELIFDERPYKKYLVKLSEPIELNYICFDEEKKEEVNFDGIYGPTTVLRGTGEMERRYKGEGTINLITYFPFAKGIFKVLSNSEETKEWAESCGMLTEQDYDYFNIDRPVIRDEEVVIKLYNAGDVDTSCRIYMPFEGGHTYSNCIIKYNILNNTDVQDGLILENVEKIGEFDIGFLINTETGLIQGVEYFGLDETGLPIIITSENLYNKFLVGGSFFKIKPTERPNSLDPYNGAELIITGGNTDIRIFYDYLYF